MQLHFYRLHLQRLTIFRPSVLLGVQGRHHIARGTDHRRGDIYLQLLLPRWHWALDLAGRGDLKGVSIQVGVLTCSRLRQLFIAFRRYQTLTLLFHSSFNRYLPLLSNTHSLFISFFSFPFLTYQALARAMRAVSESAVASLSPREVEKSLGVTFVDSNSDKKSENTGVVAVVADADHTLRAGGGSGGSAGSAGSADGGSSGGGGGGGGDSVAATASLVAVDLDTLAAADIPAVEVYEAAAIRTRAYLLKNPVE
jgi:hypothetical protein